MPDTPEEFAQFLTKVSDLALVALRHDAVRENDQPTKDAIDAEMKRRVTPQHQWQWYMNGTFCTRCNAQLGDGSPCR